MLLNSIVHVGSPTGPTAQIVEDVNNNLTFLSSSTIPSGAEIYDQDGNLIAVLGQEGVPSRATFYESRTEQQVLDEDSVTYDFGWRAKHLGWSVNFENGISLFGKLAAVNQNRQNVGIEGPTSTAGTNGSPASLFQKVNVTNKPAQVNGWKSFDSPTVYLLDPADIQQVDTAFIYADAFVSWSADTNVVSAPGADMSGLVEYDPNSSIRYTT